MMACNPLSYHLCGLIVQVTVVPRKTVVGDTDRCFDNLSRSHHKSHVTLMTEDSDHDSDDDFRSGC